MEITLLNRQTSLKKNIGKYPREQGLWLLLAVAYQRIGNQRLALKAAQHAYSLGNNQESAYIYNQIIRNEPVLLR